MHALITLAAVLVGTAALALASPAHAADAAPWPAPVKDFVPPRPGEHPRLFFRETDLPALRQRANTPEGKALIARTKFLLGGGDKARTGKDFTMFDGAAFGFLYQLTGDPQYAQHARKSVEHFWTQNVTDRDNRYSLVPPNEPMRVGPSLFAMALAYDLNYDAWPEDFRKEQAQKMMTWKGRSKKRGGEVSLERLAMRPDNPNPISNHLGLQVGGAGLTLLALQGDPELTPEQHKDIAKWQKEGVDRWARKVMTEDFGHTGYFGEHAGPGVIATTFTFIPWLQAERIANGRDWLAHPDHRAPEWLSLRFVMQTLPTDKAPMYTNPSPGRGGYGGDVLEQAGGHHATYFSAGFGAIQPHRKPAMRWVYEHFVEPWEHKQTEYANAFQNFGNPAEKSYDAFSYPHRPMMAFLNWPWDKPAENPEKTLPKAVGDPHFGQYIFRNRWQDKDDTIVAILFGARTNDRLRRSMVWSLSQQMTFGNVKPVTVGSGKIGKAKVDYFRPAEDGSGIVTAGGSSIGVDYSGAAGVDALIVMTGPAATGDLQGNVDKTKSRVHTVEAAGTTFSILTLSSKGQHPTPQVKGDTITIGKQTIGIKDNNITFGTLAPEPTIKP